MRSVSIALVLAFLSRSALGFIDTEVTVSVAGGSLHLNGENDTERITIDQAGLADPHEFRVTPGPSTSVNGSPSAQTFSGVTKDVVIDSGGGPADLYFVKDLRVPRDLRIGTAGVGDSTFTLTNCRIDRNVRIDAAGASISFDAAGTVIDGDFRARGSDAGDVFGFSSHDALGGDVRIDPRGGNDQFYLALSHLQGRVDVSESPGKDVVFISDGDVDGRVRLVDHDGDSIFSIARATVGSLATKTGAGKDEVYIGESIVGGAAKFALGDGPNVIGVATATFAETARFSAGPGDDVATIETDTVFTHGLTLALAVGTNSFDFTDSSVIGSCRVKTGAGATALTVSNISVSGSLRCTLGDAPGGTKNDVLFWFSRIDGALRYTGGGGVDKVHVGFMNVGGDVRFEFGDGTNDYYVSDSRYRGARIQSGAHDDTITIGSETIATSDVRIDAGDGGNTVYATNAIIDGNLTVHAGGGDDTLTLTSSLVVAGKTKVDLGGGTNTPP